MKKIIKFKGGIGNQLFQFAFYKFLKSKNYEVDIDLSWYEEIKKTKNNLTFRKFALNDIINNFPETILYRRNFKDKILSFRSENLKTYLAKKNIFYSDFFDGYWQDIYFARHINLSDIKDNLRQLNHNLPKKYYILHMRYGDFRTSDAHECLSENFYLDNINKLEKYPIFVLTDDYEQAELIIKKTKRKIKILNTNDIEAFSIIFNSEGGIASNSTFCWWPIFLSKNRNWFMPKKWLKNKDIFQANMYISGTNIIKDK